MALAVNLKQSRIAGQRVNVSTRLAYRRVTLSRDCWKSRMPFMGRVWLGQVPGPPYPYSVTFTENMPTCFTPLSMFANMESAATWFCLSFIQVCRTRAGKIVGLR